MEQLTANVTFCIKLSRWELKQNTSSQLSRSFAEGQHLIDVTAWEVKSGMLRFTTADLDQADSLILSVVDWAEH